MRKAEVTPEQRVIMQKRIQAVRHALGVTQAQAAREAGVSAPAFIAAELYGTMGRRVYHSLIMWVNEKERR